MASMGVNYAHLHVQQKRLKEKSKRMEEEKARSNNEGGAVKKLVEDGKRSKGKKIYPGGFASLDSNENLGKNKE
ncbi:hypothetical protein A4A49_20662 [Nicotiana attenuata]|uniref:Uncharacterized protein n=1 Tax=Nicotiana attenuata TaxID=49451 RepID=A0A1J6KTK4_NICAT|nr:hypothetical protein A4A49_20662 [Nicotiana attenuata]